MMLVELIFAQRRETGNSDDKGSQNNNNSNSCGEIGSSENMTI